MEAPKAKSPKPAAANASAKPSGAKTFEKPRNDRSEAKLASAAKLVRSTVRDPNAGIARVEPARAAAPGKAVAEAQPGARAQPRPTTPAAQRKGAKAPSVRAAHPEPVLKDLGGPNAVPGLNEEDQIRSAKYLPREVPKRLFEEERFLFPETYGVNRIRLLVRDPEWIFAYWDVNPDAMRELARQIGERTLALSRLTLRVVDPVSSASADILLPPGARWWYVRTDLARRTYRAELGVTLPSGEFRRIAESNTVVTPRVGPSAERVERRIHYVDARQIPLSAAEAAVAADERTGVAQLPWAPGAVEGAAAPVESETAGTREGKGGASDAFRSGASDAFRR